MPNINDFANEYANYIRGHINSPTLVQDIAAKVRGLSYTQTGQSISYDDAKNIVNGIQEILNPAVSSNGGKLKIAEDSTAFIAMVQAIRKELGLK
ncbi:MAG: hypothetical protein LBT46_00190 [Planctomycetaceae bacterium]|jgi:hypothetical protein|nr:hypothetical protein [Planctomycetaceae bacterium]